MRLLQTILLSLLAFAQFAFCAEDYYKVRRGFAFFFILSSLSV